MQHILYNTANGSYPGLTDEMTREHAAEVNRHFRALGSSERWIPASCDACDSMIDVELIATGETLCAHCARGL